jgi:hypothetical protein
LSARYEDLRAQVLGQGDGHDAMGLVVLLRHGVAAWIEASAERSPPPVPPNDAPSEASAKDTVPIEDQVHAELVHVVASMVLHHYQEECS